MSTPSKQPKEQGTEETKTGEFGTGEGSAIEHLLRKIAIIGQMPARALYCSKKGKFKEVFELIRDGTGLREYITKLNLNLTQYVETNKYKHLYQERRAGDTAREEATRLESLRQTIANNER